MLKLSKKSVLPGQEVVVNLKVNSRKKFSDVYFAKKTFKKVGLKNGDILKIQKVVGGDVYFTFNDNKFKFFWLPFKTITDLKN